MLNLNSHVKNFRKLEKESPGKAIRLIQSCLDPENLRPAQRKMKNLIEKQGLSKFEITPTGLRVYGHCKAAATAYWLLMGGKDSRGSPLTMLKESMPKGLIHFWVETELGIIIDPTKAQLSQKLYPHHNYNHGKPTRVGSNQGKAMISLDGKKRRIDQYTYALLQCVIQKMK